MRSGTDSRIAGALRPFGLVACVLAAASFGAACSDAGADVEAGIDSVGQPATAPAWMLDIDDHGTWTNQDEPDVVHVWLDARVANVRYHKRVLIEVAAPYGGAWMRTMHVAQYRGPLGGGNERWGADTSEASGANVMKFHGTSLLCALTIAATSAGCCKDGDESAVAPAASTPVAPAATTATATTVTATPRPATTRRYDAGVYNPDSGAVFGGPPPIATGKHTTTAPPANQPPPTSTTFGTPPGLR